MILLREVFYRESNNFIERVDGDEMSEVSKECEHMYMYEYVKR